MAYPTKGVLWLPEEVECLLLTLHQLEVGPRVMPSIHLEMQVVFEDAAKRLASWGYQWLAIQCRAKFKREKAAFFDALEDWEEPLRFTLLWDLWEQGSWPRWCHQTLNRERPCPESTVGPSRCLVLQCLDALEGAMAEMRVAVEQHEQWLGVVQQGIEQLARLFIELWLDSALEDQCQEERDR
ncbi:UNVERIFIED_CONTAM: hypothetical protein K2H54_051389 [Gekko kuhli]